jgi:alkyldihydroxyacetonephosphate synthase
MSGKNNGMKKIFMDYLGLRRVKNGAMMILVNNDYQFKEKLIGGIPTTAYPAKMWARDRYSRPALANILWKHGYVPDTLETSCQWETIIKLYQNTIDSFKIAQKEKGFKGIIMAHISHIYQTGACIYFTYIIRSENPLEDLLFIRQIIMKSILENGGSITDHHGTGTLFAIYKNREKEKMQDQLNDELFSGWRDE